MTEESNDTEYVLAREVMQHFLVPLSEDSIFSGLERAVSEVPHNIAGAAEAFMHNLKGALSTVCVPTVLALASAHHWRFQQIHISERIRARSELGPDGQPTEDALRAAWERANRRFEEELKSQEGVEYLADSASQFLLYVLRDKDVAHAAPELLRQGTVLLWGAFEILAREIFVQYLNSRPELAKRVLGLPECRRLFQMRSLDFDTLSEYAFDVSNSMGSVLASSHDLTDLPAIKTVFKALFPKQDQLRDALNSRKLWLLSQRRHLIVHNRGIVDQRYLDNTSDNLQAGELLPLTPDDLEDYIRLICDVGTKLLTAVTTQIFDEGEGDSQAQDEGT